MWAEAQDGGPSGVSGKVAGSPAGWERDVSSLHKPKSPWRLQDTVAFPLQFPLGCGEKLPGCFEGDTDAGNVASSAYT